jgi:hypothetical protein
MNDMSEDELTRLHSILIGMDIPNHRLDLTKPENLRWLSRNIAINNAGHPSFGEAVEIINSGLKAL